MVASSRPAPAQVFVIQIMNDTGRFYWKLENKEIVTHSFIHSFACSVHIDLSKA